MKEIKLIFTIILLLILILFILFFIFYYYHYFSETFINANNNLDNSTIILLGDSILNNSNYILSNEKDTFNYLKYFINKYNHKNVSIYNYAEDGAKINDCFMQLDKIPLNINKNNNNLYIILSCGGNDILENTNYKDIDKQKILLSKLEILIKTIKSKFPISQIYLLNLYYPFSSKYISYKNLISNWNILLDGFNNNLTINKIKIIDISKIINMPSDLIYDIEPSDSGSEKISLCIINNL